MFENKKFDPKNPKFVVYILDTLNGYNNFMSIIKKFNTVGINVIILSFIFYDNPVLSKPNLDVAIDEWSKFTSDQRQSLKDAFNGVILVSHGGASGTTAIANYNDYGYDKVSKATWDFVKNNNLDGVDIDYEHDASCQNVKDFTISLANIKPDNCLLTMAPEMSICQGSCWDCTIDIYKTISDKIDWFNLQYYNQDSNVINTTYGYQYTMIDSTMDEDYQVSLKEILTGKKFHNDADKNNTHCAYQYSRPPPNPLPCPDINPIPYYKLVMGSCVAAPSGCESITPTIASEYIVKASKDPNFYNDWFKGGGLMVWLYKSNENFTYQYNQEIFDSIGKILPLFSSSPKPPAPIKNKCDNVNCNKYGECDSNTGLCNCYYGYSGTNCDILPKCNNIKKHDIINDILNKKNVNSKTIFIIGMIGIFIGILLLLLHFSYYKKTIILILGIILLLVGISLLLYSRYNKYKWKEGEWSTCINNKQTRNVICVDLNGNIVTNNNCIESKPVTEQACKNITYDWNKTNWSDCIKNKQKRVVKCVDSDGNTVDDNKCTNPKPATDKDCKTILYEWTNGKWSDCVNNKQTRTVKCIDSNGNVVGDNKCTNPKPTTDKDCKSLTYSWTQTNWSDCIGNKQTRVVKCVDSDGNTVDDNKCTNPKPATDKDCKSEPTICDECNTGNICLQKNGQSGIVSDHLCVPCQG